MATSEPEVNLESKSSTASAPVKAAPRNEKSLLDKLLNLLSSVRFGLVMLGLLLICCMIGMLIMQINVEGFQKYYAALSPAQRMIYGTLGLFDIYHVWYFTLFLAITGLNIILASIDRFPAAWNYVVKPKLMASPKFIAAQQYQSEWIEAGKPDDIVARVKRNLSLHGFKARVNQENDRITIFGQRYVWNRLGAYAVHVALLTIFTGGFLTSRYGVGGSMEIAPGRSSNQFTVIRDALDGPKTAQAFLPFQIECRDIQQKLIRPEGGLEAQNTIDWLSYITIKDGDVSKELLVHLNNVGDYRSPGSITGYRFFQSQFQPLGNAREITLTFKPVEAGEPIEVTIPRDGTVDVAGVGRVTYVGFVPDFVRTPSGITTASAEYNNPVAILQVVTADGRKHDVYAFNTQLALQALSTSSDKASGEGKENLLAVDGKVLVALLKGFEKVSTSHTLTVQYDPGRTPVYIGFALLVLALCGVFFFAHQRLWVTLEPDGDEAKVYFGGNTNRNRTAFGEKVKLLLVRMITEPGAKVRKVIDASGLLTSTTDGEGNPAGASRSGS